MGAVKIKSPKLFSKVALGCPAISTLAPDASYVDINAYVKRTHADYYYVSNALQFVASYIAHL